MTDEKAKRDGKVEFSFSFENIADQIGKALGGVSEDPREAAYDADLGDTQNAKIKLEAPLGRFVVGKLDLPGKLITVESRYVGKFDFVVSRREDETVVRMEPQASLSGLRGLLGGLTKRANLFTEVEISPEVPVNLSVETGVGEAALDLRGLNLTQLKVDGGVGPMTAHLPESLDGYKTYIEGGVGPLKVHLPAENPSKIKVEGGVGPLSVVIPEDANLTLSVEGGMGPVTITLPEGTALQVKKESGMGGTQLPNGLRRVKDDLFQSEDYDLADRRVTLYVEGGMGPVRVRYGSEEADAEQKRKAKRKNEDAEADGDGETFNV